MAAMRSRVSAASSAMIAFTAGSPHSALSTPMRVSLSKKMSLMNGSRVKQATHSGSGHSLALGVVLRKSPRVGRSACHHRLSPDTWWVWTSKTSSLPDSACCAAA